MDYDQWAMRVGKAILWAAGKEPKRSLTLQPKSKELARATLPAAAATLQWQGATPGIAADIKLRRDDGEVVITTRLVPEEESSVCLLVETGLSFHRWTLAALETRPAEQFGLAAVVHRQSALYQIVNVGPMVDTPHGAPRMGAVREPDVGWLQLIGYPTTAVRRPSEAVGVVNSTAFDGLGGPSYRGKPVFR